ncbi:hypothetical protein ACTXPA_17810 [Glutamicibacter arilaitensis]|uniref:hypothetical protein n=1 Tax=Glutamicibacter arilaitensis TaxID=256701 RepID=UPI003FD35ADC
MAEQDRLEEYLGNALRRLLPEDSSVDAAELAQAIRADLVDTQWLAQRLNVSEAVARVQRSRWKESFPEPVVQRPLLHLKHEVEDFIQTRELYKGPGKPLNATKR